MIRPKCAPFRLIAIALALTLSACGLGRDGGGEGAIRDPIVAATVNGRPIYIEDVRAHAVARGWLRETEDLDANSDAFYVALEELIQVRLFAMEAEARGNDRRADVRRLIENARERVLANSIYDEIDQRATDPDAVERLYRENASRLGQGEEVHLRQIQFTSQEAADQAKRRLDQGERFEVIAFEQNTSGDGGDLGFNPVGDLTPAVRRAVENANTNELLGPLEIEGHWLILQVVDRRARGVPSLETLRPRIIDWLRYQEITQLDERLARDARIERLRQPEDETESADEVAEPGDSASPPPVRPTAPEPDANAPPFPFPMGPGGVVSTPSQTPNPAAPAPQVSAPAPAPPPAQPASGVTEADASPAQ